MCLVKVQGMSLLQETGHKAESGRALSICCTSSLRGFSGGRCVPREEEMRREDTHTCRLGRNCTSGQYTDDTQAQRCLKTHSRVQ